MLFIAACPVSCVKSDAPKVAIIAPISGIYSAYGESFIKGIKAYNKYLAETGKLPYALELHDSRSKMSKDEAITSGLLKEKGHLAMIRQYNFVDSGGFLAVRALYIPMASSRPIYRFHFDEKGAAHRLHRLIRTKYKGKRIGAMIFNSRRHTVLFNTFQESILHDGNLTLAAKIYFIEGRQNFLEYITEFAKQKIDLILVFSYWHHGSLVARQLRRIGSDIPVVLSPLNANMDFYRQLRPYHKDILVLSPYPGELQQSPFIDDNFKRYLGEIYDYWAYSGYVTARLLGNIIQAYGTKEQGLKRLMSEHPSANELLCKGLTEADKESLMYQVYDNDIYLLRPGVHGFKVVKIAHGE